jgi:hypothetical protein
MSMPPPDFENPYQPIEYAQPAPRRPGVLTAVGIISIVLGSLSVLMSCGGVFSGIMYLNMAGMTFPAQVVAPTAAPAGAPATTMPAANGTGGTGTWTVITPKSQSTVVIQNGGAGSPRANPAVMTFPFQVPRGASELAIVEAVCSLCVAVLLIVAGSLMLRDSAGSWKLHRIYVLVKIPLIAMAAIATWWTTSGMMKGIFATTPVAMNTQGFVNWMAVIQAILYTGFSLIYPVSLLIVLSTRTSKEHLARLRSGAG